MNPNGSYPTLEQVKERLPGTVLLPCNGSKRPIGEAWQTTNYLDTQTPEYQSELAEAIAVGVLLGPPSGSLVVVDCDTEPFYNAMVLVNIERNGTLVSRGQRGGSFWFYIGGNYPEKVRHLLIEPSSPLAQGGRVQPNGLVKIGEFRGARCQSIICGRHPCGDYYTWPSDRDPRHCKLSDIIWPGGLELPWQPKTAKTTAPPRPPPPPKTSAANSGSENEAAQLLKDAIAALSISFLWKHFNYPERRTNPVCSPFRTDHKPSFSIYFDGAQERWYDHGTGGGGDSFDFYQRATGKSASEAFEDFVELASLGDCLAGNQKSKSGPAEQTTHPDIPDTIKELLAQYGPPFFPGLFAKLNDLFWAHFYKAENHILHSLEENQFYRYDEKNGLYHLLSKAKLVQQLCQRVRQATSYGQKWKPLESLANAENVSGTVKILAGLVEMRNPFRVQIPIIICTNQVLSFTEHSYQIVSEAFSPDYHKRYGSPFAYDPKAMAPEFIEKILGHLEEDDRILLQKYAGQVLIGRNPTQRFLILQGTVGGASKTAFIRTIAGVIGPQGCEELRTEHLEGRFEIAGLAHASLLYGPDVRANFLSQPEARRIKSLVGGEFLTCEYKGSNVRGQIEGVFNIMISSNARLRLYVHGDRSAWERRLAIVNYTRQFNGKRIPDVHQYLLRKEGSGILNWCIEGARLLLADIDQHGDIRFSDKQRKVIELILNESDSLRLFLKAKVVATSNQDNDLSTEELTTSYINYCAVMGWENLTVKTIEKRLPDLMSELFKVLVSMNLERNGKRCRGYRFVRWRTDADDKDEEA